VSGCECRGWPGWRFPGTGLKRLQSRDYGELILQWAYLSLLRRVILLRWRPKAHSNPYAQWRGKVIRNRLDMASSEWPTGMCWNVMRIRYCPWQQDSACSKKTPIGIPVHVNKIKIKWLTLIVMKRSTILIRLLESFLTNSLILFSRTKNGPGTRTKKTATTDHPLLCTSAFFILEDRTRCKTCKIPGISQPIKNLRFGDGKDYMLLLRKSNALLLLTWEE